MTKHKITQIYLYIYCVRTEYGWLNLESILPPSSSILFDHANGKISNEVSLQQSLPLH